MLDNFPGYLGDEGVIAIHANWPNYPPDIGWQIALKTLGNFPNDTCFYEIDDIDRCKLLINQNPKNLSDPFDTKFYHLAIWHADLIDLKSRGFIEGIVEKNGYEFELIRFEQLKKDLGHNLKEDDDGNIIFYIKDDNGQYRETKYYKPDADKEDEEFIFRDCAVITEYIRLTKVGINELTKLSHEITLRENLAFLTEQLIKIGRFDTAIRDASLLLETSIKEFHDKTSLFGQRLVEFHIVEIIKNNNNLNSASIKCYRSELRTIFKFIRNDFAHNFKILTEEQCRVILSRINDTLCEFEEVINAYFKENNT